MVLPLSDYLYLNRAALGPNFDIESRDLGLKADRTLSCLLFSSTVSKKLLGCWFLSLDKLETLHGVLNEKVRRNLPQIFYHDAEICDGSESFEQGRGLKSTEMQK